MGACYRLPLLLLLIATDAVAVTPEDSTVTRLNEIVVEGGGGRASKVRPDGNVRVSAQDLLKGVRLMGEADLLSAIKRVGGVSTVGDYGSGLVIQGHDPSQILYRVDGAPVFFPYRFGGVFSTFNTTHFTSANLMRYCRGAESPSRLGATVDIVPALSYSSHPSGSVNVGLLASTLTVRSGFGNRFAVVASGRISYIDALYGRFLNNDVNANHYNFGDLNLSAGWRVDSLNTLTANYFHNTDKLHSGNSNYAMHTRIDWSNNVASLRWVNSGAHKADVGIYYSAFKSMISVRFPQFDVRGRAHVKSLGATAKVTLCNARGYIPEVTAGGEAAGYLIVPLWAELSGEIMQSSASECHQKECELRLFANAGFKLSNSFKINVGVSASTFGFHYRSFDPRLSAELRVGRSALTVGVGCYSQYLHLVGFSEIGLASNFWFASQGNITPQRSTDFSVTWSRPFADNILLASASVYYKRIKSQTEYSGQVLDIIDSDYSADRHIFITDGYNTGFDLSVQKHYGKWTGAASYSFGRAMRHLPGHSSSFRSLTDIGHQFKADVECVLNGHWSVAATYVYSSGRVYTPARYLYIIANRLITEYGERNSGRMPDYQRLDISGTYRFRTGGKVPLLHTVNLSLINAYGHRNIETQFFAIDSATLSYKLYRVSSLYRFLPSISYSIDF